MKRRKGLSSSGVAQQRACLCGKGTACFELNNKLAVHDQMAYGYQMVPRVAPLGTNPSAAQTMKAAERENMLTHMGPAARSHVSSQTRDPKEDQWYIARGVHFHPKVRPLAVSSDWAPTRRPPVSLSLASPCWASTYLLVDTLPGPVVPHLSARILVSPLPSFPPTPDT